MNNVISLDGYKNIKKEEAEFEKGCDLFAVLDHITGKAQNEKAVEEFQEMASEMKRTKPIRDNIRKRLYPGI